MGPIRERVKLGMHENGQADNQAGVTRNVNCSRAPLSLKQHNGAAEGDVNELPVLLVLLLLPGPTHNRCVVTDSWLSLVK